MRSLACILVVAACHSGPSKLDDQHFKPETITEPGAAPAGSATAAPPVTGDQISGTVLETMPASTYTYAKLDSGGKEVWIAGPETKLVVGAKIGPVHGTLMTGFHSDTLNRTFDQLYFIASYPITGSAPPNPHGADMTATAPTTAGTPPVVAATVEKIAPVEGGTTIADLYAGKATLGGKPVIVHGKVVKVNNGIMGRNWIHLQDGSGAAGTNDLTVTTSATAAKGDVVVVRGKVVTNKDFGAGYSYPVLIEDAAIAAK